MYGIDCVGVTKEEEAKITTTSSSDDLETTSTTTDPCMLFLYTLKPNLFFVVIACMIEYRIHILFFDPCEYPHDTIVGTIEPIYILAILVGGINGSNLSPIPPNPLIAQLHVIRCRKKCRDGNWHC